jgi:signal transduction histidine kinase/ActR/RegA family two-component response regulator
MKIILLLLLLYSCSSEKIIEFPKAKNGILNLTNWDFSNHPSMPLDGEWEFYYQQENISPTSPKLIVKIPNSWMNYEISSNKQRFTYATYQLKILLNNDTHNFLLKINNIFTAYELYINDELFSESGKFSILESNSKAMPMGKLSKVIPKGLNEIILKIKVSNYHHRRSGIVNSIEFGTTEDIIERNTNSLNRDFFLAGGIYILFFYHLGLFLIRKKDFFYLFFSLVCFCVGTQVLVTGDRYIVKIFPSISYEIICKLDYFTTYGSVGLFNLFLYSLFRSKLLKFTNYIIPTIHFLFCFIVLLTPSQFYTLYNPQMEIVVILSFVFIILSLVQSILQKQKGALALTLATLLTFGAVINDIFFGIDFYHSTLLTPYSLYFIFTAQAFILSIRYSEAFRLSENLKKELQKSKDDLESKVVERTQELFIKNYELLKAKQEAEKSNQIKTDFLANISHEIRTPLNGVLGIANLLKDNNLTKEQLDYVNIISQCGESIVVIINDVLDLSKIESDKIIFEEKIINIAQVLRISTDLFSAKAIEKNIHIHISIQDELKDQFFLGDSIRIGQILNNLLSNAIKFSNDSGTIDIQIRSESINIDKSRIHFVFKDTGIGIAEENLDKIFEPFKQSDLSIARKYGGTGLGLAISKKLIEKLNGKIFVISKLNQGSEFHFYIELKLSTEKTSSKLEEKVVKEMNLYKIYPFTILIVDDNSLNQMLLKKFLVKLGYQKIEFANNGLESLEKIKSTPFTLVFMDYDMPVMDGIQATKIIREELNLNLSIIAFTANAVEADKEKFLSAGMNSQLTKPVFMDKLIEILKIEGEKTFKTNSTSL